MKDRDPKKSKSDPQQEVTSREGSSKPEDTPVDETAAHLLPFAKPYNNYFDAVHQAQSALHLRAGEAYEAYVKAARDAMETRDAEALRSAVEKLNSDWSELAEPLNMASSVSRAFDAYHTDVKSAFASGASVPLGPGCFALVAYSMAVVASHRMAYPIA